MRNDDDSSYRVENRAHACREKSISRFRCRNRWLSHRVRCRWRCSLSCRRLHPASLSAFDRNLLRIAWSSSTRIVSKKFSMRDLETSWRQTFGEFSRVIVHALRDRAQSLRSMINRIHRGDHGQQDLRRADVTGGFVAPDVLLASLQRQSVGRSSFSIVRNADEPARHVALVFDRVSRNKPHAVRRSQAERRSAECCRLQRRPRIHRAVSIK